MDRINLTKIYENAQDILLGWQLCSSSIPPNQTVAIKIW
jgi:hypothetical protein